MTDKQFFEVLKIFNIDINRLFFIGDLLDFYESNLNSNSVNVLGFKFPSGTALRRLSKNKFLQYCTEKAKDDFKLIRLETDVMYLVNDEFYKLFDSLNIALKNNKHTEYKALFSSLFNTLKGG